jgi:hypothetical protein
MSTLSRQACITLKLTWPSNITLQFTKMSVPIPGASSSLLSAYMVVFTTPTAPIASIPDSTGLNSLRQASFQFQEGYRLQSDATDTSNVLASGPSYSHILHVNHTNGTGESGSAENTLASKTSPQADIFRYASLPPLKEELDQTPAMPLDPSQDCRALLLSTDWSKTSLGPMSEWPQGLVAYAPPNTSDGV